MGHGVSKLALLVIIAYRVAGAVVMGDDGNLARLVTPQGGFEVFDDQVGGRVVGGCKVLDDPGPGDLVNVNDAESRDEKIGDQSLDTTVDACEGAPELACHRHRAYWIGAVRVALRQGT